MYKLILSVLAILIYTGCSDENPIQSIQLHTYNKSKILNINPFLVYDDEGNAMTFYGQDTLSMNEYHKTDGLFDLIMLRKFNNNGEMILEETNIVKTNAILDYAILNKNNHFYVVWLDARNNPEFKAGYLNTYNIDIYYKVIDDQGTIIQDDTRLTSNLMDYREASSNFILSKIYEGTIDSLKISEHFMIEGTWLSFNINIPNITLVIFDSNNYEYHIKTYGDHILNRSKITYTKLDQDSTIIIEETIIASFERIDGIQWGPEIQNLFIDFNVSENISLCWQLNDGRNYFIYYYGLIQTKTNSFIVQNVGVQYP